MKLKAAFLGFLKVIKELIFRIRLARRVKYACRRCKHSNVCSVSFKIIKYLSKDFKPTCFEAKEKYHNAKHSGSFIALIQKSQQTQDGHDSSEN